MNLSDEMKFPYNDPDLFDGLAKKLIIQYQRNNVRWAKKVEEFESLYNAITRNGELVPYHFEWWANAIEDKQGWKSNLTTWLRSVADAISGFNNA